MMLSALLLLAAFSPIRAEAEPPSFAKGFEILNALNPASPGPQSIWHKLENQPRHSSRPLNQLLQTMNGNGWYLPLKPGTSQQIIRFGDVIPLEIDSPENPPEPEKLSEDVARIIDAVSKLDPADDIDDFRRSWSDAGSATFGPLMIFAAQVHHSGNPALADQLAWTLFLKAPSREVVIDAAINHLGDTLYNDAANRFFNTWDWQTFHTEISDIIQKLTRGWDAHPAAAMVAESISLHLQNPNPPPPSLEDRQIPQKTIDAVAWMTALPEQNPDAPTIPADVAKMLEQIPSEYHEQFLESRGLVANQRTIPDPGFWLLSSPENTKPGHPASSVLTLGIDALPVLAALADDPYPVHFTNPTNRSSYIVSGKK